MRYFVLAVTMLAGSFSAKADAILWNLSDVLFDDGTSVTGSFYYDAASKTYSSFNLTSSGGSSVPAESSWILNPNHFWIPFSNWGFVAVDSTNPDLKGAHVIALAGDTFSLADGLPIVDIEFGVAGTCSDPICVSHVLHNPHSDNLVSGQFVDPPTPNVPLAPVPEPSAALLLGTA